ncbi:MAG: arylesterase [Bacteroidia bacterium]
MKPIYPLLMYLTFAFTACESNKEQTQINDIDLQKKEPTMIEEEKEKAKKIIFFGNSITAGYRLDPADAFPNLIQLKIDSLGLDYECVNAGVSGETTAGGLQRVDWILKGKVDVFVLELGANDGLRGLPLDETYKNLVAIIKKVKETNSQAKILLCGMEVPPNMGDEYAKEFRETFIQVSKTAGVQLLPFLLQKVAGKKDLNLPDGIHPTEEGHKMVAQTVWDSLKRLLK